MNIKRHNDNGFTLIELMIVVVIIGILAAMAIPRFMEASTKSKQTEVQLIMKQIYVNQRSYRQEANAYYQPAGAASTANPNAFSQIWVEIMDPCKYSFTIVANATSFTCTATANIDDDATIDTWTIDENGILTNTVNDVGA
ncbi:MAG: prepilin-type N-terminal cleavage/methylation domain-containing protein [Calditrichaeota bacterium]|nr:MAG: prepilin-type N-terminal cleavage/methylation domain-containing protein [Calditrichota bacterium]